MTANKTDLMRTLYQHSASAVVAVDLNRQFTALNPAGERLFGYAEDEILGMSSQLVYADPRDFNRLGQTHYNYGSDEDTLTRAYRVKYRGRDGRIFDGETIGCPIFDEQGERTGFLCIVTDVTHRLALQAKLEASDVQLRAALASANEGAFSLNLVTGLGSTRGFLNDFLGIPAADATISLQRWRQAIREEDLAAFDGGLDTLRKKPGSQLDVVFQARRNDGVMRWLHIRGRVSEFGRDGSALRVTGVISDITDRQELELKLAERERQLANAITAGACGAWDVDPETLQVVPIGEVRAMLGIPDTPVEIDGRFWLDRTHEDERAVVEAQLADLASGKAKSLDSTYRLLDARTNEWRWIRSTGKLFEEADGKRRASGVLIDITEEKALREQLELSETRFRRAIEVGSNGIWEADFTSNSILFLGRISRLPGLVDQSGDLNLDDFLDNVDPANQDRVREEFEALARGELDVYSTVYPVTGKRGEKIWLSVRGEVIERDETGQPLRAAGIVTDITERRQLIEKVEESERHLRAALESANEGAWRYNFETGEAEVTSVLSRLMGLGDGDHTTSLQTWMERVHPDDRMIVTNALQAAADGETDDLAYTVRYESDEKGWVRLRNRGRVNERKEDGSPAIASGFMTDITELTETSEALALREQLLTDAIDSSSLGIWRYSYKDDVMWARGDLVADVFGGEGEMSISTAEWLDRIHPEDLDIVSENTRDVRKLTDRAHSIDYRMKTQSGDWCWFRATGRRGVVSGAPADTATGIIVNIDVMKRESVAVARERRRFEQIYNATPAMMHTIDVENAQIVQVSDFWLQSLGYTREEVIGTKSVDFLDEESRERALSHSLPSLSKTGINENIPYRFRKRDGTYLDVLLSSFVVSEGAERYSYAVMTDVTPLRAAYEQLERSNKELDRFATVASHDLQEPLRKISAFAALVRRRYSDVIDTEGARSLDFLVDAAQRMQGLIDDLLSYSKMASQPLRLQEIDLNALIGEVIETLDTPITESGADIRIDPLPHVRGDPLLLRQTFQNLISNAVKYRTTQTPEVHVSSQPVGNELIVSVSDNGIGLDPKFAEKIFAPFQRLHSRDEFKGTGIGLAIVRQAVERHGGRIWVESEPGAGATFKIALPERICLRVPETAA